MKKELFELIKDSLQDVDVTVDMWNEQLLNVETDRPICLPAVCVEFSPIQWKPLLNGAKEADVEITLHCLHDVRCASWQDTLDALDVQDQIVCALYGAKDPDNGINTLQLIESRQDHNFSEICDNTEVFHCHVIDTTTLQSITMKAAPTGLQIDTEFTTVE